MQTVHKVHPDTYAGRVQSFLTYDGVTVPQSHNWTDDTTPRTTEPMRLYIMGGVLCPKFAVLARRAFDRFHREN